MAWTRPITTAPVQLLDRDDGRHRSGHDNQTAVNGNDGVDTLTSIEKLVYPQWRDGPLAARSSSIWMAGRRDQDAAQSPPCSISTATGLPTTQLDRHDRRLPVPRPRPQCTVAQGELSFVDDVTGAHSDLEGLRAFRQQLDACSRSGDVRFSDFRVWQDRNGDGIAQQAEVLSLQDAKVRSIDLAPPRRKRPGSSYHGDRQSRTLHPHRCTTMEYADAATDACVRAAAGGGDRAELIGHDAVNSVASRRDSVREPSGSIGEWLRQSTQGWGSRASRERLARAEPLRLVSRIATIA